MTEQKRNNVYQRLNAVRKDVAYVRKDSKVQGYTAVTHDQVTASARPALIEHGVMMVPRQTSSEIAQVGETRQGTPVIRYAGWYEFDFVNIDAPDDKITVTIEAHANDHGDKAPGKAISYATKYALLKVLAIETGDDEESRVEVAEKAKVVSAAQAMALQDAIEETESDIKALFGVLNRNGFQAQSIEELTVGAYNFAMQQIEKKRRRMQEAKSSRDLTAEAEA